MTVIDVRDEPTTAPSLPEARVEHASAEHPDFLAHHFDTPGQQFEAAKLGMWLFIATEVLLFGGLFCMYAILRGNHPEMFKYGSQFLDTRWGAINTAVLLISSMTMALSVTAAQRGQKRLLIALLLCTFLGGAGFMSIKYIEYTHKFEEKMLWGAAFYQKPEWLEEEEEVLALLAEHEKHREEAVVMVGDAAAGVDIWMATCRSCHGLKGEGVAGQGKDQRGSAFIASSTDPELVEFIKVGRTPFDPMNTTGLQMPPLGGNPMLVDQDLFHLVAYIRTFDPAPAGDVEEAAPVEMPFEITRSVMPDAVAGQPGFSFDAYEAARWDGPKPERDATPEGPHHSVDPDRPRDAHLFFSMYYLMTGLHGIHVLAGMGVMVWLLVGAIRGRFHARYFTPVDLGGLYWHVVDLIWIFLFPIFYLIG